jgi:gamma-glutamylcyclotransferase (GGCT)/AIG2-like uncharacterized protein YtfP
MSEAQTKHDVRLFSYGTLRLPEVQHATFGRLLKGSPDAVVGFRLETLKITDPHVVATSGSDEHPLLVPADDPAARVEGVVFLISEAELAEADEYEVAAYVRIEVPMASGGNAWVYVFGGEPDGGS